MTDCAKRTGGWCEAVSDVVCIAHSGVGRLICRTSRMTALKVGVLSETCRGVLRFCAGLCT